MFVHFNVNTGFQNLVKKRTWPNFSISFSIFTLYLGILNQVLTLEFKICSIWRKLSVNWFNHCLLIIIGNLRIKYLISNFFFLFFFQELPLRQGSQIAKVWAKPPITPYLKLYFFNVTNHEEFLNGSKPVLEEIGPFTYS